MDNLFGDRLRELVSGIGEIQVVAVARDADTCFALIERHHPRLAFVAVDLTSDQSAVVAETLSVRFPDLAMILVAVSEDQKLLRLALSTRAREVLGLDKPEDTLRTAIGKVIAQVRDSKARLDSSGGEPDFKIITVFSPKGGVGKTTISANLALALRHLTGKRVIAVDLDVLSGNLGLLFGVPLNRSLRDLVVGIDGLDLETVERLSAEHGSGVKVLPGPPEPDYAGLIQPQHVDKILKLLPRAYTYVVVDSPAFLHDALVGALEVSDFIVMPTTLDLASIQSMKFGLDVLGRLSLAGKVRVVANRVGYTGGLKVKDIESQLGLEVCCSIPDEPRLAVDAVNTGVPVYELARHSLMARRFNELACKVMTEEDLLRIPRVSRKVRRRLP